MLGDRSLLRYAVWGVLTPLSVPDLGNWWLPWAVPACLRELKRRSISVIYATGPPFSSHILGAILKMISGIPLVIDSRDEWTLDPVYNSRKRLYWRVLFSPVERIQQRWVVRKADKVILDSDSARRAFVGRYGESQKFITIRSGYDPEDLANSIAPDLPSGKLRIVYTGSTLIPVARPYTFLRGLRLAIDRSESVRDNVLVYFVGEVDPESLRLIVELELESHVTTVGYVSHPESVGYLRQADVSLLIADRFPSRVPAKLYEYLGAKKPVLVLACRDGEALELLSRAGTAVWADPRDSLDVAGKLIELETMWRRDALIPKTLNEEFIQSFSRERLTGRLAAVFDDIAESYPADRKTRGTVLS